MVLVVIDTSITEAEPYNHAVEEMEFKNKLSAFSIQIH